MKTITRLKPMQAIEESLKGDTGVCIVGCGTCATMCRTGGHEQVAAMADALRRMGKVVTGAMVIPTACDEMSAEAVNENRDAFNDAGAILVMACAFGVQTIAASIEKPVAPALDTLFIGKENGIGVYSEVCRQCGECVLDDTGGICPVTSCHKGLLNGPCGGTNNGKCEIDREKDCAWTLIYRRLDRLGRLDRMKKIHPPKNYQAVPRPGKIAVESGRGETQ
ncbi:MAG: methylenetetrahydrofolate reductase C-terminal domain-containing protein [bacterium]